MCDYRVNASEGGRAERQAGLPIPGWRAGKTKSRVGWDLRLGPILPPAVCAGGSSRVTWSLLDKRSRWNDHGFERAKVRKWNWRATVSCSKTENCNERCGNAGGCPLRHHSSRFAIGTSAQPQGNRLAHERRAGQNDSFSGPGRVAKKAMNASVVLALAEIRRRSPILEVLEKKATPRSPAPCTTQWHGRVHRLALQHREWAPR